MGERMIAPDLIQDGPQGPLLLAGRRRADGKIVFPLPTGPERDDFERITLPPAGRLWSWTVQRIRPKSPPYVGRESEADYTPFVVGYVEFPGQVIVEGRIDAAPDALHIGSELEICVLPFAETADGERLLTFGFRPCAPGASRAQAEPRA